MTCTQHSAPRNRKERVIDAPYCRKSDWWKNPDKESEETSSHWYDIKRSPGKPFKRKIWSIILVEATRENRSAELEAEFNKLVKQWKEDTLSLSSLTKIYAHPAYQRIMAMGTDGIPFVLKELQEDQGPWFYALKYMAGKNVSAGMINFVDAKTAWLEWGHDNNYV